MLLQDIKGLSLGETTLEILNLCVFYTVSDIRKAESSDFEYRIKCHVDSMNRNSQENGSIRASSYWKSLRTRCKTVVLKIRRGSSLPLDPDEFCCMMTGERMEDPVITPSGYSYERLALETWLNENSVDPMTREPLQKNQLIPNRGLLAAIRYYETNIAIFFFFFFFLNYF